MDKLILNTEQDTNESPNKNTQSLISHFCRIEGSDMFAQKQSNMLTQTK